MTVAHAPQQQLRRTALAGEHEKLGAKMVEFQGWWMPLYYHGILEEHRCVREHVGLFDVSHMGQIFLSGPAAGPFLQWLLTNDVEQLSDGTGHYSLMLNEQGGILDDVIVFRLGEERYLLIVNCATHERDLQWLQRHAKGRITIDDVSDSHAILAIQGPTAPEALQHVIGQSLAGMKRFAIQPLAAPWGPGFLSRTGYTGGEGFEVFLPNPKALLLWRKLVEVGHTVQLQPIGLGARDSVRLEAGLRLYGTDMDETTIPDEAGLEWVVAVKKGEFCGRDALLKRRATGVTKRLVGLTMLEPGAIPRSHCPIQVEGRAVGHITSGSMSPLLGFAVGLGSVEPSYAHSGQQLSIIIRQRAYRAQVVGLPFVPCMPT